jgi:pimeloyl-ACP methyl ester carboxylesterase
LQNTFIYKNIHINYTTQGKGSVVVLLHGFLENLSMWNDVVVVLQKRHRVIAIDLLGHGKTDNLSYVHTMDEQAQMVKAVLGHLKVRRYFLIGHSLGGYIALAFAELFTDTIKGICLMNSTALADSIDKKNNREKAINLVKKHPQSFVKMAIPNLFSKTSRTIFKDEINLIIKDALKTSKQGVLASLEGMKIRKDRTQILKNKIFKKLLIIGEKDPILKLSDLKMQVQNMDVEIVIFSNGHMSHIENKEELIRTLSLFTK